jgi:Na+/proline symporter
LIQRGLAAGFTILAPSIILSALLHWNLSLTNIIIGSLVIIYTVVGGTKAVSYTHNVQMVIILAGMFAAGYMVVHLLPEHVSFGDALTIGGKMGRLNVIDFSFDWKDRYNIWTGLIGGTFLAISYFGTDQSQVQRYLAGSSITQSRMGLFFNAIVKIPMQFFVLLIGVLIFVFYQYEPPPIFFNNGEVKKIYNSPYAEDFKKIDEVYSTVLARKKIAADALLAAMQTDRTEAIQAAKEKMIHENENAEVIRANAIALLKLNNPDLDTNDTNYIFLSFVTRYLPSGLVGLLIAVIFAASMSSTSAELNALAATSLVDIYKRQIKKQGSEKHYVVMSKIATILWGLYAIAFTQIAKDFGTLIEAVNILGSLFYGTILGIFLLAFYFKRVSGIAVFYAAIIAELSVCVCWYWTEIPYLWFNALGCIGTILIAIGMSMTHKKIAVKAG